MRLRSDEEPDPIIVPEPDEPDEPEPEVEPVAAGGAPALVPAVATTIEREYEYRVEVLGNAQILDGKTLPDLLSTASHDEWHLVEIIDTGENKAVLLRKRKEPKPERRPVGFMRR